MSKVASDGLNRVERVGEMSLRRMICGLSIVTSSRGCGTLATAESWRRRTDTETGMRHRACGELRELLVEERGKSIEVGKSVERPVEIYWPGHGRNPGVPDVRSHCTTRSWGTRESSVALALRRSSSLRSPRYPRRERRCEASRVQRSTAEQSHRVRPLASGACPRCACRPRC